MSALTGVLGMIAGRVVTSRMIPALGALEPGRYPHPVYGPVVIPRRPDIAPGEPTPFVPPFQITGLGLFLLFGGLLMYAAKRKPASLGEQRQMFPGLRRELRMEPEDTATSDDPVEACLERVYGWNLNRMRELRDSIAAKETPDLFTKEKEPLTAAEAQLLDQIEACLERVQRQYGSLEAAGLPMIPCPCNSPQS